MICISRYGEKETDTDGRRKRNEVRAESGDEKERDERRGREKERKKKKLIRMKRGEAEPRNRAIKALLLARQTARLARLIVSDSRLPFGRSGRPDPTY